MTEPDSVPRHIHVPGGGWSGFRSGIPPSRAENPALCPDSGWVREIIVIGCRIGCASLAKRRPGGKAFTISMPFLGTEFWLVTFVSSATLLMLFLTDVGPD